MKTHLFKSTTFFVITILLSITFSSCSKSSDDPQPQTKPVAVTGVSLNKDKISIEEGKSETLTATVSPAGATNQKLSWASDKTDIATVNSTGKVTGVKAGTATITVTTEDGKKTATCSVTVTEAVYAVTGVTIDKTDVTVAVDKTVTLKATIAPENATNPKITWSSSDTTIATVDETGTVTGVKKGTAIITVTTDDGNKTATCNVTVAEDEITIGGFEGTTW